MQSSLLLRHRRIGFLPGLAAVAPVSSVLSFTVMSIPIPGKKLRAHNAPINPGALSQDASSHHRVGQRAKAGGQSGQQPDRTEQLKVRLLPGRVNRFHDRNERLGNGDAI